MPISERILVVEQNNSLGVGLEYLIKRQVKATIIGILPASEAILVNQIRNFQPNVIVMDSSMYITTPGRLLDVFTEFPSLTIVVVSTSENTLHVFSNKKVPVNHVNDLIDALYPNFTKPTVETNYQEEGRRGHWRRHV